MRASNSSKKKLLGSCRGARNNKPIYRNEIDWFVFLMFFAPLFPPQSCCFCARHSHNLSFFSPLLLSLLCSRFIPPKCVRVESASAIVFAYQHLFPEKKREKVGGFSSLFERKKLPKTRRVVLVEVTMMNLIFPSPRISQQSDWLPEYLIRI